MTLPSKRRRGRLRISTQTMLEATDNTITAACLSALMSKLLITEAHHNWATDCFEYTAMCPMFRELDDGEVMPLYEATFEYTCGTDGSIDVTVTFR